MDDATIYLPLEKILTWTCHICGDTRDDKDISVFGKTDKTMGVPLLMNIRYCNDRLECINSAPNFSFLKRK